MGKAQLKRVSRITSLVGSAHTVLDKNSIIRDTTTDVQCTRSNDNQQYQNASQTHDGAILVLASQQPHNCCYVRIITVVSIVYCATNISATSTSASLECKIDFSQVLIFGVPSVEWKVKFESGDCRMDDDDLSDDSNQVAGDAESREELDDIADDAALDSVPLATIVSSIALPISSSASPKREIDLDTPATLLFEWLCRDIFSNADESRKLSDKFYDTHGRPYELIFFPYGNAQPPNGCVSMYLKVADCDELPPRWKRRLHFTISCVNQLDGQTVDSDATNIFCPANVDWGFATLISRSQLKSRGFILNGAALFRVSAKEVDIEEELKFENTREEVGVVGIKNQGATCYLNSLLQTLFHTNKFRRAVYDMFNAADQTEGVVTVPLALQKVFYDLQTSLSSVSTQVLTKSFGWDSYEAFTQHDVQELSRVLCDRLEERMKGTRAEGTIATLFEGRCKSYIRCLHVPCVSQREETFCDIQLSVKGLSGVIESFREYTREELMEGDNMYQAEGFEEKQEARKGLRFLHFPPVLNLHLKRFEYDAYTDAMVKINDHFEFPVDLDLNEFLAEEADRSTDYSYVLHSVLVHRGTAAGGHYYCYIRMGSELPARPGQRDTDTWVELNDEGVRRVKKADAVDRHFGVTVKSPHYPPGVFRQHRRFDREFIDSANAYMLVYVRKADLADLMAPVDIPRSLADYQEELANDHLYISLSFVSDRDFASFREYRLERGVGTYSQPHWIDLVEPVPVSEQLRVRRDLVTMPDVMSMLQERWGVLVGRQRFWRFIKQKNYTSRPACAARCKPAITLERMLRLGSYGEYRAEARNETLTFYMEEVDEGSNEDGVEEGSLLLLLKILDPSVASDPLSLSTRAFPRANQWAYIGSVVVPQSFTVSQLVLRFKEVIGAESSSKFTAVRWVSCKEMSVLDASDTLQECGMRSGDVISFERSEVSSPELSDDAEESLTLARPTTQIETFFGELLKHKAVRVRRSSDPLDSAEKELLIHVDLDMLCARLPEMVGTVLRVDPSKLRLTYWNGKSKFHIKSSVYETVTVGEVVNMADTSISALLYEELRFPLRDLEAGRVIAIEHRSLSCELLDSFEALLGPEDSTLESLFQQVLQRRVERALNGAFDLYLLNPGAHSIYCKLSRSMRPESVLPRRRDGESRPDIVWVMEVSGENTVLEVQVVHESKVGVSWGIPCLTHLFPSDSVTSVQARLGLLLRAKVEDLARWPISFWDKDAGVKLELYTPARPAGSPMASLPGEDSGLAREHEDNLQAVVARLEVLGEVAGQRNSWSTSKKRQKEDPWGEADTVDRDSEDFSAKRIKVDDSLAEEKFIGPMLPATCWPEPEPPSSVRSLPMIIIEHANPKPASERLYGRGGGINIRN